MGIKTQEQFIREVKEVNKKRSGSEDEYTVEGLYIGALKKIGILHRECGRVFEVTPSAFLMGRRCKHCYGVKKRTKESFKEEVKKHNKEQGRPEDEYVFQEEYKGIKYKTKIIHNKEGCGYEYSTLPSDFLNGHGCPKCAGNLRKTNDEFLREVQELNDRLGREEDEYVFKEEYVGTNTPIKVEHTKCGKEYTTRPKGFLKGNECRYCQGHMKKTNEEFVQEIRNLVGDGYTFLEDYVNTHKKMKIRHNACGYEYEVAPKRFIHEDLRCLKCTGYYRRSEEDFLKEVHGLVGEEYKVLGKYVKITDKILVEHLKCGSKYAVRGIDLIGGSRCTKCGSTFGEQEVEGWLERLGVSYERQYKLLRNTGTNYWLRVDFGIKDTEGKLLAVVEYDGKQHFTPIEYFGGEQSYKGTVARDSLKNTYCEENKIPLLRIPYWEFNNIETILKDFLEELKIEVK